MNRSSTNEQATAYLNGEYIPFADMKISIADSGFMQGVTVTEQIRTFNGAPFRLDAHLARLQRSLEIIDLDPGVPLAELAEIAEHLVSKNHPLLAQGDDLGVTIFVTPGSYAPFSTRPGPTIGIHTQPVLFGQFADKYEQGQRLVVSQTRQISAANWPSELKCRSRMHYYLADREARRVDPAARALLLDLNGNVSEASTANVLAYKSDRGFLSPPHDAILPGISLAMLRQLADELQIPFHAKPMAPTDFATADEVLLCSTSPCVLPVVALDNKPISGGKPGEVFHKLIDGWSRQVGVDIIGQARQFASRG